MNETSMLLTPDDIAREYKESKSAQAKRRMRGDGPPYIKRGNRVLTYRKDYEAWLETLSRRSTSDNGASPLSNYGPAGDQEVHDE